MIQNQENSINLGISSASNKARVFTVSYTPNATEAEIKEYGAGKFHTLGVITAIYFYPARYAEYSG